MINQLVLFAQKIESALVHGILKKHLVAACILTNSNLPGLIVMPKLFVTLWRRKKQLFLSPVKDCLVKDSPVKDSFTQDLQEVITNHQEDNAYIEETTEVPPSSKRGTRKKNTEIVDTAPVGRPEKIG